MGTEHSYSEMAHEVARRRARCRFVALILSLALAGCASLPGASLSESDAQLGPKLNVALVLEKAGIAKLREGRHKDASRIFNAGLKFDPTSADLNFFNGLTYQLLYLRGNQAMLGLAEVGYQLALRYNPAHYHAALQLGRLQFEAKRYDRAASAFQRAINIRPGSGAAYLGLASADYYVHKLRRARVAAEKAASLMPASPQAARAQAMIYAALGEGTKAQAASVHYATLQKSPLARANLDRRVHDWRVWHVSFPEQSIVEAQAQAPPLPSDLPQVFSPKSTNSSTPTAPSHSSTHSSAPKPRTPQLAWYDCKGSGNSQSADSSSNSSSYDSGSSHELPALPSPCVGAPPPRMAILDVVFVKTKNIASSSYGINLLQGLNFVFGFSRVGTFNSNTAGTGNTNNVVTLRNESLGGADFQSQIAYSLNIVNSTNDQSHVLSKPSLIALDRMPSTFFSGANLTVGLVGGAGSYGSIENQPVGIRLSVTPTFIGKDKLLLAVRAERSFLAPVDLNVNFQEAYETTSNVISADVALKMGQTLILSGLSEKEVDRISNGVPVLKDIPGLQYLFNNTTTQTVTKSVLVLITPRPAAQDQWLMQQTMRHIATLPAAQRRYAPLIEKQLRASHGSVPANLPSTYAHAANNTLFLQFRTGDLSLQHWADPSRLSRFFKQLRSAFYYSNE